MRIKRIIARTLAKKRWSQEAKLHKSGVIEATQYKAFRRGWEANRHVLEHCTDQLSYDVEVGGVHG